MLNKIKKEIRSLANPTRAKLSLRFFKTGPGQYGEGDKFLGLTMPETRSVVEKYWEDLSFADTEKLLHSPWHEERMVALLILVKKFEEGSKADKTRVYNIFLKNIRYINNWDLVDVTVPRVVGVYLLDKSRKILYQLAKSKNLWERRIAILATFAFIYNGQSADTIKIAKILLKDKHDLIHKAVGWMLREVGKRCSVKILEDFLRGNVAKMPRTMLRYSIEKMPLKRRKHWMTRK
ncbi:MAG: DNA alkylation repair protein [Candidatus Magasanikbacteria bacterium RIFOXYC2_FULL_42_28]|uniref:DNA alkylation repair protein n=1 Tax=Candidatus Magasanikbacteria bacterium RIFOXYC2_FULL_42_28 TaxID=1798704 RepID=A0A1F6NWF8_9BACT|nr:MAG: DNA alkylation repair protein [Candidatus Magasanikbacteria bacterium RIFOXYC2_FULL_42_28]